MAHGNEPPSHGQASEQQSIPAGEAQGKDLLLQTPARGFPSPVSPLSPEVLQALSLRPSEPSSAEAGCCSCSLTGDVITSSAFPVPPAADASELSLAQVIRIAAHKVGKHKSIPERQAGPKGSSAGR